MDINSKIKIIYRYLAIAKGSKLFILRVDLVMMRYALVAMRIYRVVQTGANTQLGGANIGSIKEVYQRLSSPSGNTKPALLATVTHR